MSQKMINNDHLLLSEAFINAKTNSIVDVHLYSDRLVMSHTNSINQTFKLNDLAGVFLEKPFQSDDSSVKLLLYFYVKMKEHKFARKKLTLELEYDKHKKMNSNLFKVKEWKKAIDLSLKKQKPFLVFINPNSGSGKASKLCLNNMLKVWNQANHTSNHFIITGI